MAMRIFFMNSSVTKTLEEMAEVLKAAIANGEAKIYKKFGNVKAEMATKEQKVDTIINGVLETTNIAHKGDYIITGAKGELYVIKKETFEKRYKKIKDGLYKPVGECIAIEWKGKPTKFKASWGEDMIINPGDMLAAVPGDEHKPYRIEKEAFAKTYK